MKPDCLSGGVWCQEVSEPPPDQNILTKIYHIFFDVSKLKKSGSKKANQSLGSNSQPLLHNNFYRIMQDGLFGAGRRAPISQQPFIVFLGRYIDWSLLNESYMSICALQCFFGPWTPIQKRLRNNFYSKKLNFVWYFCQMFLLILYLFLTLKQARLFIRRCQVSR